MAATCAEDTKGQLLGQPIQEPDSEEEVERTMESVTEHEVQNHQPISAIPPVTIDTTPIEKESTSCQVCEPPVLPDSTADDGLGLNTVNTDDQDGSSDEAQSLSGDSEDVSIKGDSESVGKLDDDETGSGEKDFDKLDDEAKTAESRPQDSNVSSASVSLMSKNEIKQGDNRKSSSGKSKKKEDKSIEHILRALNSLQTTEEKLAALCKKYADLHEEHRVLQGSFKQSQRRMTVVMREKDQIQSEHTKAVMAKSKLESLCRELQRHNRIIKEESLARAREEDEKRKEISNKFQATIGEIQTQMTDNHERNVKLREENAELAGKLKKFIEQYDLKEQQVEKIMKHRELEKQLSEAKLGQANAMLAEHEERNKKEKELLLLQCGESHKKASVLEAQLTMYKERYEEFQSTINKSNEMFQKFKTEMDKMGKRIKKLEKEGATWRSKWENNNKALVEMVEQKARSDKEKATMATKITKLESLCRALQGELHGKKVPSLAQPVKEKKVSDVKSGKKVADVSQQKVSVDISKENVESCKGEPSATPSNTLNTTSHNTPETTTCNNRVTKAMDTHDTGTEEAESQTSESGETIHDNLPQTGEPTNSEKTAANDSLSDNLESIPNGKLSDPFPTDADLKNASVMISGAVPTEEVSLSEAEGSFVQIPNNSDYDITAVD